MTTKTKECHTCLKSVNELAIIQKDNFLREILRLLLLFRISLRAASEASECKTFQRLSLQSEFNKVLILRVYIGGRIF